MKIRILVILLSVAGLYGMDDDSGACDPRFNELRHHAPWWWNGSGGAMVEVALRQNNSYALEKMFDAGLRLDERNKQGDTLLHIGMHALVETDRIEIMANLVYLLRKGCDPQAKDRSGDTPWEAARKHLLSEGRNTAFLDRFVASLLKEGKPKASTRE